MQLTTAQIAAMLDVSAVKAESSETEVRATAELARRRRCIAVFTLPAFTPLMKELLAGNAAIRLGGVVGFPGGGTSTVCKAAEARELVALGCHELDMVLQVGMLRSDRIAFVRDDIAAVVKAAGKAPVKVILECHYLTEAQIKTGCALCLEAGAAFVKTATGWAPTGATPENVRLIKSCVGERALVKAAGGIRDLKILAELYRCGARRFGLSVSSAGKIFEECDAVGGVITI